MEPQYSGQVRQEEVDTKGKKTFNWFAFFLWMISLIISLIPVYISALKYLETEETLDINYWFQCITKDDVLWVFATLLLFALFNSFVSSMSTGRTFKKKALHFLYIIALLVFALIEATWICLKYLVETVAVWPIYLGIFLMICSLIISTPLEINFIRNEDQSNG